MKTNTCFFYSKDEAIENGKSFYTVFKVNVFNGNVDEAERKSRTIAHSMNEELAGGYFMDNCKPFDFKTNYDVIDVPNNTKIEPYNEKDKFIMRLIEVEENMPFEIF